MIEKPPHIYKALAEAISAWGNRHYINARSHLAEALGFNGQNASIQLSNTLNYKTYNPKTPKALKLGQLSIIFDELDKQDVAHVLSAMGEPYGLICIERDPACTKNDNFHAAADDVMIESDDVFKTTKLALKDQTLDESELENIIKELDESDKANARLKQMAKERLKKIQEDE